ncbi:PREDICTED: uncharacterized protein LOC107163292 [Diuraphis noxia]|uniref:uncharacterized protein LOC107163292 n=1 Tax=Diuraphis noxia TaxID=143948 RepID=UPI0007636455|nr:PREDICTED: uncharacterized protein LOC107163292 [Diuraphis noxia]
MADSVSEDNPEYGPSPIKKGKSGKIISEDLRIHVINMYKCIIQDEPTMSMRRIRDQISEVLCISDRSIHNIIKTYKETNTVPVPKQTRKKKSFRDLFDDFAKNAVRIGTFTAYGFAVKFLRLIKSTKPYPPTTVCHRYQEQIYFTF